MNMCAALGNEAPSTQSLEAFILSAPDMPWLDDAACGNLPLDQLQMFFVEAGRTIVASTIAMCSRCPVRAQCLDHAYRHEIVSGYFGGISPGRRKTMTRAEALAEINAG